MPEFVRIAVNVPRVSGVFDYHLPQTLEGRLRPGHLVLVPFGERQAQGVVLRSIDQPEVPETKAVEQLLDEQPVLTGLQLDLATWLAEHCLAPLAACVNIMLPPGLSQTPDVEYVLTEQAKTTGEALSPAQQHLLELLKERGPLRSGQINYALPKRNWRSSAAALERKGLLVRRGIAPIPSLRTRTVPTAEFLAAPEDETELGRQSSTQQRRAKIMAALRAEPGPMDSEWLFAESGGNLADLRYLAEHGWIRLAERETYRDPTDDLPYDPALPPKLTGDQARVWQAVHKALAEAHQGQPTPPVLLHGVTGSGKTEIYLQAVAKSLAQGRSAIVLVPEIALTPQTVQRFLGRFPGQVGLVHSELSEGERYDTWRRARAGQLRVIVGPRSALFAPLPDLGLIVVDEEHDDSYYEAGQDPHYHARTAAVAYAEMAAGLCLLGSATPDVGSYAHTQRGNWQLQELPARILAHRATAAAHKQQLGARAHYQALGTDAEALELPPVSVVDMRRELKMGNRSIFSQALQSGLRSVLEQGQQAILFLNRRGSATYVFCRDCGHVLRCPNCDNPLTQHLDQKNARLLCHHCGYTRQPPKTCPECGGSQIRYYGTGTETVEEEVHALFPQARTLRWDRSSTRAKGAHERILHTFSQQGADILVGTQMLAKGLDLPLVTLVGVVLADVGLNLPDYRAAERVFQTLTQVAGRAGRSPLGGQVVLQTFNPAHYAIQAAAKHDYAAFYKEESANRRTLRWPPFAQLLRLEYRHEDPAKAEADAEQMGQTIRRLLQKSGRSATEMVGSTPCFYARLNRQYRWQILLRGPQPATLLEGIKLVGWRIEVDPPNIL